MAMADITRVVSTGPSAQRVGVVFVAEGYQAAERSKFLADVAYFRLSVQGARQHEPVECTVFRVRELLQCQCLVRGISAVGDRSADEGFFCRHLFSSGQDGADGRLNYGDRNKLAMLMSQSFAADARVIGVVLINARCTVGRGSSAWVTTDDVASIVKRRGYAEFGVNGQSTASASRPVRKHDDIQEARSTRRIDGQPAGQLQEA